MNTHGLLILLAFLLAACDEAATEAAADAGVTACVAEDLIAQCPLGSNPLLGAQAEAECSGAIGGVVLDGEGQATGQCYGVGSCRVVCQFAVACRCGVERVSREGVICADCEGAASCGNGMCEGGENPQLCPQDCGAVCNAGERRCDGELLQECNLQGRFDTLPCPSAEVCDVIEGLAQCARDPDVIVGGDAGVEGDSSVRPEDGRLILGEGSWPVIQGNTTAPFPRNLVHRWLALDSLEQLNNSAGSYERFRLINGGVEGAAQYGSTRWNHRSEVELIAEPDYPPASLEQFCAAWLSCRRNETPEQCAGFYDLFAAEPHGEWQRNCITDQADDNCQVVTGGQVGTCLPQPIRYHPQGVRLRIRDSRQIGGLLVGPVYEQTHLVAIDLDTHTLQAHEPIGEYLITHRYTALSADGRVAMTAASAELADKIIIHWNRETGERRALMPRAVGDYLDMALSPDGQVLALAVMGSGEPELDAGVSLWNVAEERRIVTLRGAAGRAVLAFSPDGQDLAVDAGGGTIEIWRLGAEPVKQHTLVLETRPDQVAYAPDGVNLALYESTSGLLSLWDTRTGERWWSLEVGRANYTLSFTPDGQQLIAGGLLVVEAAP